MNVRLYSNVVAPEVYCNIYHTGALATFDYFSKRVFLHVPKSTPIWQLGITEYDVAGAPGAVLNP